MPMRFSGLGAQHVDFAQIIKSLYNDPENETRYSPADAPDAQSKGLLEIPIWKSLHEPH